MQKNITALLLCLLLCCGAMIPLIAEMEQVWQADAVLPSDSTQLGAPIEEEEEMLPADITEITRPNITIIDPDDLIIVDGGGEIYRSPITGYGVATEGKLDWQGIYQPYTGGEMELELFLRGGASITEGVAVMLFLNGKPQPFSLEESQTAYQHTVYPGPKETSFGVSFIPVQGVEGETMELCVLFYPNYNGSVDWEDQRPGHMEDSARFFMIRIEMEATPPEAEYPEITQRVVEVNISDEYAPPSIHDYWSIICNGKSVVDSIVLNTGAFLLEQKFRLYSGNQTAYVLIVYVDDEPVYYYPYESYVSETEFCKQIQLTLDCVDLQGDHTVFALVLKQHYWTYGSGWEDYPDDNQLKVIHLQLYQ